tara:strand:- start:6646 stop:8439 length:1794 start_codon:yes stop_codon:yes gene_type:complete
MDSVFEIVRKMEDDDERGETTSSKFVTFSLRETINKISAYLNSKHTTGETDTNGREKPFFNIVTSAVNIYYRATDIDRKNITVTSTKQTDILKAFLATLQLQKWMRKTSFGQFLNEWGRVLSRYGSAVSKFVEQRGELVPTVISWDSLIVDPVDFDNNVVIEKLWLTPAQLRKNKLYDQELVEKLLEDVTTRETSTGETVDGKADYIPVYEVHGELPLSFLTDDEKDEDEYVQQTHHLTFLEKKDGNSDFEDYDLYSGREKNPYRIDHLIKEDGKTLSIGAVENLFDAQWMVNHSQKQIKDQLDLASKMLFQTSDGNFVGQNAMTNIQTGDILIHQTNEPLTQLNNTPDIASMQSNQQQWQQLGMTINGISEAMQTGEAKSGAAWRQVEALLQESHSLFELMTENKGLSIEEMLREFIIPHIKKNIDTTEEISEILQDHQIKFIDSNYVPNEALRRVEQIKKEIVLQGQVFDPTTEEQEVREQENIIQGGLNKQGRQRFIQPSDIKEKTWKESLKDLEWDLDVDITGEVKDKRGALATLNTLLQALVNPKIQQLLQTDEGKMIVNKILDLSGTVSPVEMSQISTQPQVQAEEVPQLV